MDALAPAPRPAYRVRLSSWTCSFRYPNLISGFQPTLHVPPLSTVLGLLNAAAGRYLPHQQLELGYVFDFAGLAVDVETIWMVAGAKRKNAQKEDVVVASNNVKSNPVRREFLFEGHLTLYLFDEALAAAFRQPAYQLLLGRSGDLATVDDIRQVTLHPVAGPARLRGQVVPLHPYYLPGQVQALPQYFTNTLPRQNLGTQAYSVLSPREAAVEAAVPAWYDADARDEAAAQRRQQVGSRPEAPDIFLHQLQLAAYAAAG
ncbi:type I-B CRISPR-associated protein Cas5b [Hymenobacter weizhouensis]|uniref:type I-B CRISPR-associated protein Cas5b n=1 Tax=Hymenobacter sp. YIM 151500-1 TaxID=2987689 RepID=UPI00222710E2|nr:type I-B CRISPR-associated protein Cas5b [Hymenobacter sp. YIM 151500-1]UYZ64061.1 type I-B CRISPR-associated protein Cas5b [Hymenobacter sp. YIM 151500-1]